MYLAATRLFTSFCAVAVPQPDANLGELCYFHAYPKASLTSYIAVPMYGGYLEERCRKVQAGPGAQR